jgi:cation diffusion facilitator CzcD-associated flavoprotein CzcO
VSRRIGIIGAGAGGICAAVKLRAAGFADFVILEQADGIGGTWRHNCYPGLTCDIKSHLYSYSFAPKLDWRRPYGSRDEILAYLEAVVDDQGLRDCIRFGTQVVAATWDEDAATWTLVSASGDTHQFDVVVAGIGMFNELQWPDIDGLDSFEGTVFHTARWNETHRLDGERVGVIGSAASAVQLIPELAKVASQLYVFQRSANWVLPKEDVPWTVEQLDDFRADPAAVASLRSEVFEQVDEFITFSNQEMLERATAVGRRVIDVVHDPEVRAKLTPNVPYGCQRPLISNDYYPTFNRSNVELVVEPIRAVTPDAVVTADGLERAVDALVVATGFKTTLFLSSIDVKGRAGADLATSWSGGAHAYLGITTSGFPNLFMLYGPNTNNGSIIFMLECQVEYIVQAIQLLEKEQLRWIDVRSETEARYNDALQRDLESVGVWAAGNCHNYYRGASGHIVTQWPHSMSEYRRRTEQFEAGDYLTSAYETEKR